MKKPHRITLMPAHRKPGVPQLTIGPHNDNMVFGPSGRGRSYGVPTLTAAAVLIVDDIQNIQDMPPEKMRRFAEIVRKNCNATLITKS